MKDWPSVQKAFYAMPYEENPDVVHAFDLLYSGVEIRPHAGWSIGLERLTMTVTGMRNIRECCMFPRDRDRLVP